MAYMLPRALIAKGKGKELYVRSDNHCNAASVKLESIMRWQSTVVTDPLRIRTLLIAAKLSSHQLFQNLVFKANTSVGPAATRETANYAGSKNDGYANPASLGQVPLTSSQYASKQSGPKRIRRQNKLSLGW
jgi:hypothetical protein